MGGSSYEMNVPSAPVGSGGDEYEERGRTRGRSPLKNPSSAPNPFDDNAADPSNLSLRGASRGRDAQADSPTERRSMFHENV